jgi:hypothetical protein
MNERIRKIAEQAERQVYPVTSLYNEDSTPRVNSEFEKKFAELIVKECMDIAKQVENEKFEVAGSAEPEYRTGINDGRRNAAWGIKNRMKLHFGVEE